MALEVERCANALRSVVAGASVLKRRLRRIGGSISFTDARGGSVILVATRETLDVREGEGEAAVNVEFRAGAMDAFSRGELSVASALIEGRAHATGDGLRALLSTSPILGGLLRQSWAEHPSARSPGAAAPAVEVPDPSTLPSETWAVDVQNVHKRFGSHEVLRGVDLRIPEGAITVLLGPSGTGKSVMIKHLIGLLAPDAGEILIHGRRLSRMSVTDLLNLRRRYGVLFQDGALFGSMNVFDNVAFPLRQHTDLDEPTIARIAKGRLEEVGLLESIDRSPAQLSGGMRKRVGFARALVLDPEIVLFDEPDSGLDPVRTSLLSDLVLDMHPRYGGTYVVITHNIAVARKLGEYIALLYDGGIVASGTREQILSSEDPFVRQFLAGEADGPLGMD